MIYNVLSIDLDILFSPSIGFPTIIDKIPREINWRDIYKEFNKEDFQVNPLYDKIVVDIFQTYSEQVKTIYTGYDHSSILNAIHEEFSLKSDNYIKFDIYNIDFHHDVVYSGQGKEMIDVFNMCDCGCWVGYLNYNNYLNKYCWLNGVGSRKFNSVAEEPFYPTNYQVDLINNYKQYLPKKIDLLYVAYSLPWIPVGKEDYIVSYVERYKSFKNSVKYYPTGFNINYEPNTFLNKKIKQFL